jgi:hypothetical protein
MCLYFFFCLILFEYVDAMVAMHAVISWLFLHISNLVSTIHDFVRSADDDTARKLCTHA